MINNIILICTIKNKKCIKHFQSFLTYVTKYYNIYIYITILIHITKKTIV